MSNSNLPIVYGVLALLSALLFASYILFAQKKNRMFLALFGCVALSNSGYFLLAVCNSLTMAKVANGLSYFGGAFSLLLMVMIISEVCRMEKRRLLRNVLLGISICVFAIAASGDWLGLYYRSMTLEEINGMTHLVKEYGPLHNLYALYLLAYVLLMVGIIVYASKTKRLASPKYTLFLLVVVLLNVGVWLVEQLMDEEFEFLSVSYMVTVVMLLLIYGMFDAVNTVGCFTLKNVQPQFFLLPLIFPLLHVAYGVGTLVGLLQIPFWRRKIKNSHAKEHIEKVKRKIKENTRK